MLFKRQKKNKMIEKSRKTSYNKDKEKDLLNTSPIWPIKSRRQNLVQEPFTQPK
jgi:hypothetical protein